MKPSLTKLVALLLAVMPGTAALAASDDAVVLDQTPYANRAVLPDFTGAACPDTPRSLKQVKGNLYRHTTGAGLAVHSGLVLVTTEGALVIDPAMSCTSGWLKDEIKKRFNVPVKYVVYTHAHADHVSGGQIFQQDGATVIANQRAVEPIVGEKLPTAVPDKVFDENMTITLGGEEVRLHRVAPSHSNSMVMVYFPGYKALQCTDVCESKSMPYNDFLDFYYDGWVETLDWVIKQDVDVIDVGHYSPAKKEDIVAERNYIVDLHRQVLDLVRAGQSWDELYRNVKFSPEVQSWTAFSTMKTLNILGMYRWVSNHRRGAW
ncbi:MBL fold metallo-hydrolase [Ochrobactrum soli]|uniref:MBL fold metallo-hydrolase n=1 Tax=Ochrobactrum soli TaxID=2448455 RepID=UPI000EF26012|nr:MBL fold metallo-hydrolase [[Ochrobactrum] soli]RLL74386.1 MBL fold metallo-hydrolase [[Ochrobactrum] soli]